MGRGILACLTLLIGWPALAFAGLAAAAQPAPALGDLGLVALGVGLIGTGLAVLRRRSR